MRVIAVIALALNVLGVIPLIPLMVREVPHASSAALFGVIVALTMALSAAAIVGQVWGIARARSLRRFAAALNAAGLGAAAIAFGALIAGVARPGAGPVLLASVFVLIVLVNIWFLVGAPAIVSGTAPAVDAPSRRDRLIWNVYWACAGIALFGLVAVIVAGGEGAVWAALVSLPVFVAAASLVVVTGAFVRVYEDVSRRRVWLRQRWLAMSSLGGYDTGTFRVNGIAGLAVALGLATWITLR